MAGPQVEEEKTPGEGEPGPRGAGGKGLGTSEQGLETHSDQPSMHTTPPPLQSPGSSGRGCPARGPSVPTRTSVDSRPSAPSSGAGEGMCRSVAGWGWREKSEVLSLSDLPGEESCAPDHLEFIRKWEPWVHPDSACCIWKDLFPASSENNQMGPNQASEINPQRHLCPFKSFLR